MHFLSYLPYANRTPTLKLQSYGEVEKGILALAGLVATGGREERRVTGNGDMTASYLSSVGPSLGSLFMRAALLTDITSLLDGSFILEPTSRH
jgi:hypothetical protein